MSFSKYSFKEEEKYKTPSKIDSSSIIGYLANQFGVDVNGVKTFKTDTIYLNESQSYKGVLLSLQLVESNDDEVIMGHWKITDLLIEANPFTINIKTSVFEFY